MSPEADLKTLPIGISTFRFLIEDDMVYVDKTGIIETLASRKGRYFLSRPRRFGKSLLVDTLKELFEGNEPLFRDLAIHANWDWSTKYPVVKIDFAGGILRGDEDFSRKLMQVFDHIAGRYGIRLSARGIANRFTELIQSLHEVTGSPVVLLVDEYDKPLLDNIGNQKRAAQMRDLLKDLFSPIKELDEHLQFVFLTGVSKFSKVNIFSGINNLNDITLDENYAALCGYTQADLELEFSAYLEGVDREELKRWYNGYCFLGEPVYNPFDILLFISKNRSYRNYWFETGTPSFLVRLMQQNRYFLPDLEGIEVGEELLSSFELEAIEPVTLLFQSGYLTIKATDFRRGKTMFRLGFPNQEVKIAFTDYLVASYTHTGIDKERYADTAYEAMRTADMKSLESAIRRLFAGIPWRNFTNNDLSDYEGYYASVLYAFFTSITGTVIAEDSSNRGQADLTVLLEEVICVTEIKVADDANDHSETGAALAQIRTRNYAGKYIGSGKRIFEVAMVFSREERNLAGFEYRERTE
jgi:hypothetical protein